MKGSTRGKQEKQTSEGSAHVSWPKDISENYCSLDSIALLNPGVRDGNGRQDGAK